MKSVVLDRRTFLASSIALAAAPLATDIRLAAADELGEWLTSTFAADKALLEPGKTGALPPAQAQRLGRFTSFLIRTWELERYVEPMSEDVLEIFGLKTGQRPSYLTEYGIADATIERARISLASEEKAFDLLAFGVLSDPNPDLSRLSRFRKFVFSETARYLIASGGFRRFKPLPGNAEAKNYAGYIAGPFTNPDYLPYRGVNS